MVVVTMLAAVTMDTNSAIYIIVSTMMIASTFNLRGLA